jgi:hypothetical protein
MVTYFAIGSALAIFGGCLIGRFFQWRKSILSGANIVEPSSGLAGNDGREPACGEI